MRIQVLRLALEDLKKSYHFYERLEKGLGSHFRTCLEQDLVLLKNTAGVHRKIGNYHHVNAKVFKSIIYYRIIQDRAVVFAILDGRIDPVKRDRILNRRR